MKVHFVILILLIDIALTVMSGPLLRAQTGTTYLSEMQALRDKYGVTFVYESSLPLDRSSRSVSSRTSLTQSIRDLFEGSGIRYEIRGHTVILRAAEEPARVTYEEPAAMFDTLRPAHIEAAWRDTLVAAKVSADRLRRVTRTQTGLTRLDGKELNKGFAVFSTPDLIKTLQLLPGVASGTELMSGLFVHGGTGGDNLFLLDGSSIYNTSHLIGLFSAFNTDVVDGVDFYKSGFPARYGGRLSSVVDVTTRDGDLYERHGTFSLGLIDGRIQLEGPLVRGRTSFIFGLRRTWMDTVTIPIIAYLNSTRKEDKSHGRYAFWDMNLGITHHLTGRDILRLRFFNGMDRLRIGNNQESRNYDDKGSLQHTGYNSTNGGLAWGSTTAGLTWNHVFSDEFVSRVGLYYSYNVSSVRFGGRYWSWFDDQNNYSCVEEYDRSGIHGIRLGADFDWEPTASHHIRFGASWEHHAYIPNRSLRQWEERGKETEEVYNGAIGTRYGGEEPSLYIEDEMTLLPGLTANAGVRAAFFLVKGKAYALPEPRFALRYDVSDAVALKASYTWMNQFEHWIQTTYVDLPTSLWLPSTAGIHPMHSQQAAAGVYSRLPHGMHLDVEGFWKTLEHIYEYSGPAALYPPVDRWESAFTEGRGRAYGAEMAFGWEDEDTKVDVAYTLSWTERFFSEFSDRWYRDRNDNRHKFNVTASHKFSRKFEIYGGWIYHSGNRMTVGSQGKYLGTGTRSDGKTMYYYEKAFTGPNNIKLPDYHRLDVGMNFIKLRPDGKIRTWNLSIYNVYCRMNTVYADVGINEDGEYVGESVGFIPIIPTFSYTLRF